MCRNGFSAVLAAVLVTAAGSAAAQTAEMRQVQCSQLLDLPGPERNQLALWLHGYHAGSAQRSLLDRGKLEEGIAALIAACERNRSMPLIGVEARAALAGEPIPGASGTAPAASPPAAAPATAPPAPATPAPGSAVPVPRPAPLR